MKFVAVIASQIIVLAEEATKSKGGHFAKLK